MFRTHKGNCYCYTGAFLYMARRLGYQAYGVSGSYKKNYVDHAWVMIGDLVYDPCLEYLIPVKNHFFMDLYGIDPKKSTLLYHFP